MPRQSNAKPPYLAQCRQCLNPQVSDRIAELCAFDFAFAPLERARSFVVLCGVVVKGLHQLVQTGKAGPVQRLTRQNIKPDFDLVKPARAGRGEVKRYVGVRGQPVIAALVAR